MSFDTLRVKVGRRPVTIVEVDLDFCELEYGVSPCTAAIGTTGEQECFNTFKTCQDTANYDRGVKTYRFCTETGFLPIGENILPCVVGVDIAPTQLDPKGLSVSASATITLKDFPHHDRGIDPYVDDRGYDPSEQGSFFGKLRARNPYLINRPMRVMTGYVDEDRTIYTRSRTYFVDRIEGPDANGRVRIIGKDPLRFADADKAECPVSSKGLLSAGINNSVTSLTLTPSGVGADYPSSGRIRIGDELIDFASRSSDTLNSLTRGVGGTTAASHSSNDAVQLCKVFTSASVPDVVYSLLVDFAGIDSSYIPFTDWEDENDTWLGSYTSSVTLSDPTGVKDLLKEVLEASGSVLWWDEVGAKWRWKVIVPLSPTGGLLPAINEREHILAGSLQVKDLEKERLSRVIMQFDPISAVGNVERANFRSIHISLDAELEGENAYGSTQTKEILNRWTASAVLAEEICTRILERYKETPREATFKLDAKDFTLNTGDLVDIDSRLTQNAYGEPFGGRYLITECRETDIGSQASYTALLVSQPTGTEGVLIAPDDLPVWASATDRQRETYLYISDDAGHMSDGSDGPLIGP